MNLAAASRFAEAVERARDSRRLFAMVGRGCGRHADRIPADLYAVAKFFGLPLEDVRWEELSCGCRVWRDLEVGE